MWLTFFLGLLQCFRGTKCGERKRGKGKGKGKGFA